MVSAISHLRLKPMSKKYTVGHVMCWRLKRMATVVAWGRNQYGQARVPVGLSDVIAVAAGDEFSLALTSAGQVVVLGAQSVWPSACACRLE